MESPKPNLAEIKKEYIRMIVGINAFGLICFGYLLIVYYLWHFSFVWILLAIIYLVSYVVKKTKKHNKNKSNEEKPSRRIPLRYLSSQWPQIIFFLVYMLSTALVFVFSKNDFFIFAIISGLLDVLFMILETIFYVSDYGTAKKKAIKDLEILNMNLSQGELDKE